jgi:hypothetical protein
MTSGTRAGALDLSADTCKSNDQASEVCSSTVALPVAKSTRLCAAAKRYRQKTTLLRCQRKIANPIAILWPACR